MSEFFIDLTKEYEERFSLGKFMEFVVDNHDPLNSHVLNSISGLAQEGFITYKSRNYRPDLASEMIYGDNQYWWVLLIYNGLSSPDDLKYGQIVAFPSLADLEELYFSLKLSQGVS